MFGVLGGMFTRTLLLTAFAAALAVAPAQAGVVDQDLGQPDMARHLVFSGDAYDNEMGLTGLPRSGRLG